jgi:hypothetical protein
MGKVRQEDKSKMDLPNFVLKTRGWVKVDQVWIGYLYYFHAKVEACKLRKHKLFMRSALFWDIT